MKEKTYVADIDRTIYDIRMMIKMLTIYRQG